MSMRGDHARNVRCANRGDDVFLVETILGSGVEDEERRRADEMRVGAGTGEQPGVVLGETPYARRQDRELAWARRRWRQLHR
jgi:hypothetical protein